MKARPTVLGLMGVVACVAVGLAAARSNDEFSAAGILALTVAALCTTTLVAIYRRGAWAGFAVFGWAQFLICQPHTAPTIGPASLPMGIACRLLTQVHHTAPAAPVLTVRIPDLTVIHAGDGIPILMDGSKGKVLGLIPVHGLRANLCLSSILVGFLGAIVGGFIARRNQD